MCTYFMRQILGLYVVVQTSSSRNLASVMCTDIIVSDTGIHCCSTDLSQDKLYLRDVYWFLVSDTATQCSSTDLYQDILGLRDVY